MKSRIVLAILILLWMITVFCFSSDNSQESSSKSQKVVEVIVEVCDIKTTDEQKLITIETIVRKCAHMIIYTIGGILIFLYCNTYDISLKKKLLYTVLIGGLYAITDEIHQGFSPGRSPQVTDILIDTTGVTARNGNKLLWIKNL